MKLEIKVFKSTGKFYADQIAESKESYFIFDDKFKVFVYENLPAILSDGYVVVSNADPDSNEFYEALYKFNDLHDKAIAAGAKSKLR